MKITTAWTDNADGARLLSAYSETDFDNWNGVPTWHQQLVNKQSRVEPVRELVIEIPDGAIIDLFETPTVNASIVED